jgi:predicted DNA-binding protein
MKEGTYPVSVRLDPQLKRRAAAFARRRKVGLTTALRMIISEHLDAAEAASDLDAALRWQREQAWGALERWERGDAQELTLEDIRAVHRASMDRKRRR